VYFVNFFIIFFFYKPKYQQGYFSYKSKTFTNSLRAEQEVASSTLPLQIRSSTDSKYNILTFSWTVTLSCSLSDSSLTQLIQTDITTPFNQEALMSLNHRQKTASNWIFYKTNKNAFTYSNGVHIFSWCVLDFAQSLAHCLHVHLLQLQNNCRKTDHTRNKTPQRIKYFLFIALNLSGSSYTYMSFMCVLCEF
jgi:hypothetical protein